MSQPRRFHLFNCDNIYELSVVEDLMNAAKAKLGFEFSVEKHNFTLSEMSELSTKTIPEMQMDFAILVVHAHESVLLINNDNLELGYAKVYRALMQAAGGNVIIVIGGDDNYRNEDEEDQVVISRWAKRKIFSQFSKEYLDGRKSFIFSWNKKHRPIHEEALMHYFDPSKKGQKFEYQPKPKQGGSCKTAQSFSPRSPLNKAQSMDERRGEDRSFVRSYSVGQKGQDRFTSSTKSAEEREKQGLFPRSNSVVQRGEYPSFSHIKSVQQKREDNLFGGPNSAEQRKQDSLFGPPYSAGQGTEYGTVGPTTAHLSSMRGARPKEMSASSTKRKDLAVLGWQAKPEWMQAVELDLIGKHKKELNLAEDPDIFNDDVVTELTSYLQNNPLKVCVLLVDAEKVRAAMKSPPDTNAEFWKLQETAERNVARKVIIIVCCELPLSHEEEKAIDRTMRSRFKEKDKVFITTFKKGNISLEPKHFLQLLTSSSIPSTNPQPPKRSGAVQIRAPGPTQQPSTSQSVYPFTSIPATGNQYYPRSQGRVTSQPSYSQLGTFELCPVLAPDKTVMLHTRLREGRISNRPEDAVYWKPDWVVPDEIEDSLFRQHYKKSDLDLVIFSDEKGQLICQVTKTKASNQIQPEGRQHLGLAQDEVVKLKTVMYNGQISFKVEDIEIFDQTLQFPKEMINSLKNDYQMTPKAELLIASDSKDNLRCIVKVGRWNTACSFINKKVGANAIM